MPTGPRLVIPIHWGLRIKIKSETLYLYPCVYENSEGFYGSTHMRRLVLAFLITLSARQQNAIQMIFLWRADSGHSLHARQCDK